MTLCFNLLAERAARCGYGLRQTDAQHFDLYQLQQNSTAVDHNQTQINHQDLLRELATLESEQQQ